MRADTSLISIKVIPPFSYGDITTTEVTNKVKDMSSANREDVQFVNFIGDSIPVIRCDDGEETFLGVVAKGLVENLGLDWSSQHNKLVNNPRFNCTEALTEGVDGKTYRMTVIPLRSLNAYLFSINPMKIPEDKMYSRIEEGKEILISIREKIIMYQDECIVVLYDYWNKGMALNLRLHPDELMETNNMEMVASSNRRYERSFNVFIQAILDAKGVVRTEQAQEFDQWCGEIENLLWEIVVTHLGIKAIDRGTLLVKDFGSARFRPMSGYELMVRVFILDCFCNLVMAYMRGDIGGGDNYQAVLDELPGYVDETLENMGHKFLSLRSTYNKGLGLTASLS